MENFINIKALVGSFVFSVLGLIALWVSFYIFDKITPGDLWDQIVNKHNVALAIVAGATTLAIAQIVAAAIHG